MHDLYMEFNKVKIEMEKKEKVHSKLEKEIDKL